jgi:hypothetical protein
MRDGLGPTSVPVATRRGSLRTWPPRRRSPLQSVATVGLAFGIVLLLSFSAASGGLQASQAALTSAAAAVLSTIDTFGLDSLENAEHSLADGDGPAGGIPLNCTYSGVTLAGQCQSTSTTPIGPAQGGPNGTNATTPCESPYCLTWQASSQPAARTQMAIAFDNQAGYVVAFGGWNGTTYFNDTWEFFDLKWAPLNPRVSPSPRAGAAMAFDKKSDTLVLFGGHDGPTYYNDTWAFTVNAQGVPQWALAPSTTSPSPRAFAAMTFDTRDYYIVLFGGWDGTRTLSDTWKYKGGEWVEIPPATAGSGGSGGSPALGGDPGRVPGQSPIPPGREDSSLIFDTADNITVMFGGLNLTNGVEYYLNDTWEFLGGVWTSLTLPHAPPPRAEAVFAFDVRNNTSVLFGGVGGNQSVPIQFDDTWTFRGGVWTILSSGETQVSNLIEPMASCPKCPPILDGAAPSARQGAAGAWDLADNLLIVFSGDEGGLPASIPDTWTFTNETWSQDFSTQQWTWPDPSARYAASMAYVIPDDDDVLFGGVTGAGANAETWVFNNESDWTQIPTMQSPSARSFASLVYDATDGYVLLFGGRASNGSALGDTWSYQDRTWTELSPMVAPPARYGAAMTFDGASGDGYVVLYGGVGVTGQYLSDTWTYLGGVWTQLTPSSSPGPRGYAEAAYDVATGYVVLYGGFSNSATLLGDTWTFVHGTWTNITATADTPTPRWGAVLVDDPANGNIIFMTGGCAQAIDPVLMQCDDLLNESWEFSASGNWNTVPATGDSPLPLTPQPTAEAAFAVGNHTGKSNPAHVLIDGGLVNQSGGPLTAEWWFYDGFFTKWFPPVFPSAREGGEGAYDVKDDSNVYFGGYGALPGGGEGYLSDTWEWNKFEFYPALPRDSPSPRAYGAIAWDDQALQVVYFGGYGPTGYLNDTWAWLGGSSSKGIGGTGNWHHIVTPTAPSPRANESMAYDYADGVLVLFGGQYFNNVYGDTWRYWGNDTSNGVTNFSGRWLPLTTSVAPSARASASMIYDFTQGYQNTTIGYLVLFGGLVLANGSTTTHVLDDTWEYLNNEWIPRTVSGDAPPARFGAAFAPDYWDYDNATDPQFIEATAMLFGGATYVGGSSDRTYLNDTWTLDNWVWTQDLNAGRLTPAAGAYQMLADEGHYGNIEMFGGSDGYPESGFWTFY